MQRSRHRWQKWGLLYQITPGKAVQVFLMKISLCRCDFTITEMYSNHVDALLYSFVVYVDIIMLWRCHQMEIFSALLAICAGYSPVTGEFSTHRPVTWSFDVLFDLRLNEWLRYQLRGWWIKTPSGPLWRHSNVCIIRCVPLLSSLLPATHKEFPSRIRKLSHASPNFTKMLT